MSLTSCYRYVLELPVETLSEILRAAISEDDSAGIAISRHWENVPVGSFTATVDVRPSQLDTNPPTFSLTTVDLGMSLALRMRADVKINEVSDLDQIEYELTFDFPGTLEKTTALPPTLDAIFPNVTEASLNLVVSGGDIPLTAALIEPRIHALYQANPSLGHDDQFNVPWPLGGTVQVTTDIFDDAPGATDFRGSITVDVPAQNAIVLHLPGHFRVRSITQTHVNTDMTVDVKIGIQPGDGELRVLLSAVQSSDVTVTFVQSSTFDSPAKLILKDEIAAKLRGLPEPVEHFPKSAEVRELMGQRLVETAAALRIPVFAPPVPATPGEVDFTAFVPTTVDQRVLAIQLLPLNDGTPCDPPDAFAKTNGFSAALAAVEVQARVQDFLAATNGTTREIQGYDVTVRNLAAALSDAGANGQTRGHIWITGTADVAVDCWPDPSVDFWGPIFPRPTLEPDGTLSFQADTGTFGADDPCCADVDPAQIAALVGAQKIPGALIPTQFRGVGELRITAVNEAETSSAGIVVHGAIGVVTNRQLHAGVAGTRSYWAHEGRGGSD